MTMDNNNNTGVATTPSTAGRHRRLLHLHRQQFYKNNSNLSSSGDSSSSNISLSICIQETTFCSRASTISPSTGRNLNHLIMSGKRMSSVNTATTAAATVAATPATGSPTIDQTRLKIEQMEINRIQRRLDMQQRKMQRAQQQQANIDAGNPGDVDFIGMITSWRNEHQHFIEPLHHSHHDTNNNNVQQSSQQPPSLCVVVRKRGLNDKERAKLDFDSVTCFNPHVTIHSAKFKVDGISKYMHHNTFRLDHAFDEHVTTQQIYQYTVKPLLQYVCCNNNNKNTTSTTTTRSGHRRVSGSISTSGNSGAGNGGGGRATVFCYGQTGSGKTYTMNGIQQCICLDLFQLLSSKEKSYCTLDNTCIMVSFFELYGGQVYDLLQHDTDDHRPKLKMLEDANGEIVVTGLSQVEATNSKELQSILERGMTSRTTHQTEANDTSSRSHAICQILLYARENSTTTSTTTNNATATTSIRRSGNNGKTTPLLRGKLSLVDLAGSESSTDTKSHNAQRRAESSDINTSLLALKECIRALDRNKQGSNNNKHVPYRGSKLTLLLKDCFTSPHAISTMIATVSPGASATDHSLNTLRYADRIKEQRVVHNKIKQQQPSSSSSSAGGGSGGGGGVISGSALLKKIPMRRGSSSPKRATLNTTTTTLPPTTPTKRPSNIPTTPKRDSKFATTAANNNNTTNRRNNLTTSTAVASSKTAVNNKSLKSASSSSSNDRPGATTPTRKVPTTPSPSSSSFKSAIAAAPSLDDDFYTADEQDNDDADDDDNLSDPDQTQESIQVMYDQECEILSLHMQNIQENADLLTQEGKMLKDIQQKISLEHHNNIHSMMDYQYMDDYVEALARILDRKEDLIGLLQDKVMDFKQQQEQLVMLSQSKVEPELDDLQ